jgi:hypothetical protein
MSWLQIEKKHQEKFQRDFVHCREPEERDFLINAILETFSFIKREDVEKTFDHFCTNCIMPAERGPFLARVREHLGREITYNYVRRYIYY